MGKFIGKLNVGSNIAHGGVFGPSTVTHAWIRVDGGIYPGEQAQDIVSVDTTHVVAGSFSGKAAYSSDGGLTWTLAAGTMGGITQLNNFATNGANVVAIGVNGVNPSIAVSTDFGHTWTDVTPSLDLNQTIVYSTTAGKFFTFSFSGALVWYSTDGITWSSHAVPASQITFTGFGNQHLPVAEGAGQIVAVVAVGLTPVARLWSSSDAVNWTETFNAGAGGGIQTNTVVCFTGLEFGAVIEGISGHACDCLTSISGLAWGSVSNSSAATSPPYASVIVGYLNKFFNGLNISFSTPKVANSTDGTLWTDISLPPLNPDGAAGNPSLTPSTHDGLLYAFSENILSSPDGVTWTTEQAIFTSAGGFFENLISQNGNTLAVGLDDAGNGGIWKRT